MMERRKFILTLLGGACAVSVFPVLNLRAKPKGKYGTVLLSGWSDIGDAGGQIYLLDLDARKVRSFPTGFGMSHSVCWADKAGDSLYLIEQYGRSIAELSPEGTSVRRTFSLPNGQLFNGHAAYRASTKTLLVSSMKEIGGDVVGVVAEFDPSTWAMREVFDLGVSGQIPHDVLLLNGGTQALVTLRGQRQDNGALLGTVALYDLGEKKILRKWSMDSAYGCPGHFSRHVRENEIYFTFEKTEPGGDSKYNITVKSEPWTDTWFKLAVKSMKFTPSNWGRLNLSTGDIEIISSGTHGKDFVRPFNIFWSTKQDLNHYIIVNCLGSASILVWDRKKRSYLTAKRFTENGGASACLCPGGEAIFSVAASGEISVLGIPDLRVIHRFEMKVPVAPHPFFLPKLSG